MTQEMSLHQFKFTNRLRVAWALEWPCAALFLIYSLAREALGLPAASVGWLDFAIAIIQFFLFATWVIRRAVRHDYATFRIVVNRGSAGPPACEMNYRESLSVTWLLVWRAGLIGWIVRGVYLEVFRTVLGTQVTGLQPLSLQHQFVSFVMNILIFSLLLNGAIRKQYSGFSLGLEILQPGDKNSDPRTASSSHVPMSGESD